MTTIRLRAFGFALPVLILATGIHVEKDPTWGSWLDGILSGVWFAALALIGAWAAERFWRVEPRVRRPAALREIARGALFGGLTWILLWATWKIPGAENAVGMAFMLNSVAFALAGAVLASHDAARLVLRRSA